MKSLVTQGIVLTRTNFGEADRIITVLTPDQGKLRLIAKGVRKVKSKLAGGIELFSVTEISYITGKSEIGTLVSSRLETHYGRIVKDIDRVQLGYNLLKAINKATEDSPESEYFDLLNNGFKALDDKNVDMNLIAIWFGSQLIKINGHTPNLTYDTDGNRLDPSKSYGFDIDSMSLVSRASGDIEANHIKLLRLLFSNYGAHDLQKIEGVSSLVIDTENIVQAMMRQHLPHASGMATL